MGAAGAWDGTYEAGGENNPPDKSARGWVGAFGGGYFIGHGEEYRLV
ncbi:hypothetical protein AGMMS4952_07050 [Spirochaetia bacterium]|nr:hypothetical protein AGMMS4952_07050 [Spirochaetia bacterium]